MSKPVDDLEAVRILIQTLDPFSNDERERIIRWTKEKLGMVAAPPAPPGPDEQTIKQPPKPVETEGQAGYKQGKDVKTFIDSKEPQTANHLAAATAYYYRFVAPKADRKETIDKQDLLNVCRMSDRQRPKRPQQVLVNAYSDGLLNRTSEAGQYTISPVGENLVAMVLPGGASEAKVTKKRPQVKRAKKRSKPKTRKKSRKQSRSKN